jgi:hypothetical protein
VTGMDPTAPRAPRASTEAPGYKARRTAARKVKDSVRAEAAG